MWYPVSIEFKNLFSHEHTLFNFKRGEMLMLIGPNGIGKSTIIEAITLAITGDVYRKVNKDEYIREGQEEAYVDFVLHNDVFKQTFRIERTIHITDSSIIKLYENGKPKKDLGDKRTGDSNKYIFTKLGITKEDFLNYFVIGQGNHNSFFGGTDAVQKEIISRFSNSTNLDNVIAKIDSDIKSAEIEISDIGKIMGSKIELFRYLQEEVKNIKHEKEEEYKIKKAESEQDIKRIKDSINSSQVQKIQIEESINHLRNLPTNKSNAGEIKKLEAALEQFKARKIKAEDELTELSSVQGQMEVRNGKVVACPKCKTEFIPNVEVSVEELRTDLKWVKQQIQDTKAEINICSSSIKKYREKLTQLEEKENEYKEQQLQLKERESRLVIIQERCDLNQKQLKEKQAELAKLKQPTYQAEIKKKQEEIKALEDEIKALDKQQLEVMHKKENLMFHQFHFGRKGFKTFLANKSIKNLQDISNYYLNKFQTNLQVLISGFKINKNGDIKDKIEISIIKNGRRRGSFHKFSGGEKSRVDLTGIIAVHKLINNSCETGGLDLLCLDENISYLDKQGQIEITEILKKASITSVLVMHWQTEVDTNESITLKKENEITKLIA